VTDSDRPLGQRFSHVYLRSDKLVQDSSRARRRTAGLFSDTGDLKDVGAFITRELGVDLPYGYVGVDWAKAFKSFEARDFLDIISVACRYLDQRRSAGYIASDTKQRLVTEAARIFAEENLCYELDSQGGVHFRVDAQFAVTTTAAIAALSRPRYANAREQFEDALSALAQPDIDGKRAIRGVFNAVECLYRLMFPSVAKLSAADATKGSLQSNVQAIYQSDPTAQRAASKSVQAFGDWVDACHNYRHEVGQEEPAQPPLDLAIQLISGGATWLRWLIDVDSQRK
jgi:hypothetical protein